MSNRTELTKENYSELIRNSGDFMNLALVSLEGVKMRNPKKTEFGCPVTLFLMHNSLELILKSLLFIKMGNTAEVRHNLVKTYQHPKLHEYRDGLDTVYSESVNSYEKSQTNPDRRITKNNLGEIVKYDPSNFLCTLKRLDKMHWETQRYSQENPKKWDILPGFNFLFRLFNNIAEYSVKQFVNPIKFQAVLEDQDKVWNIKGNSSITIPLRISRLKAKDSEHQRRLDALFYVENGTFKPRTFKPQ